MFRRLRLQFITIASLAILYLGLYGNLFILVSTRGNHQYCEVLSRRAEIRFSTHLQKIMVVSENEN